ncbi:MAG TPA: type VI secretion system tip protein TssI/VgrG, partial [Polyangiaceae bacterium]|nr:type VI secretion system tip protein TssI/VgrG [Polyangiaceae bacterium]
VRRSEGVVTDMAVGATRAEDVHMRVVVESYWALARHVCDMRVFREQSTVDIARELLERHGVKIETRLSESYRPRAQCVQLRESDLDFVMRLFEEDGIVAFDAGSGTLVLTDAKTGYIPWEGDELPFRPHGGLEQAGEAVLRIADRAELGPERVTLRDFRRGAPRRPVQASTKVGRGAGFQDVWLRGPSERAAPERSARIAAEARRAELEALELEVASVRVAPGQLVRLTDLPDASLPSEVLVVRVRHAQPARGVVLEAVPSAQRYRVPRRTPRPVQAAPLTAFVQGPERPGDGPGSDVHTDELGRVKIRYPFDRRQPWTEQASDWVPVMQDQTGQSVAIPRVGSEVLVHFIEGDPDRPVVLGRLYNGADPFPEPLPDQKTVSSMRSPSSPDRGGKNMIRIDDSAGAERVDIEAERDQRIVVAQDERRDVGVDRSREVLGSEDVTIGRDATTTVGDDAALVVGGDLSWSVGQKRSARIGKEDALVVGGEHCMAIGASHLRRIGGPDKVQAKEIDERTGGAHCEIALRSISLSARKSVTTVTGGASVGVSLKGHKSTTGLVRAEAVGGLLISKSIADTELVAARKYDLKVGGAALVNADSAIIQATTLEMDALGSFELTGGESVVLRVGDNEVKIVSGAILVKAKQVLVDGKADLAWEEAEISE